MPVRSWDRPHSQSKGSTIVYGFKTRTTEIELINGAKKKKVVSRATRSMVQVSTREAVYCNIALKHIRLIIVAVEKQ